MDMEKKLYLIDGHALVFKMYYAFLRRPMINSKGVDTSILFGFTKYILELIEREKPTHFAVAFDPPGGTFRHEMYPEYKAQREACPEDIKKSVPIIKDILHAMRIPVLEMSGYEADDVLGTIAGIAEKNGMQVSIISGDRDLLQLATETVQIRIPKTKKGGPCGSPSSV